MRKTLLLLPWLLAAAPLAAHAAPRGEAKLQLKGKNVTIDYGQPSLNGRDMIGRAEVGQTWRMGADSATTLTTETDLAFGSVVVPKGSYVLTATRKTADQWTLNVQERNPAEGKEPKKVAEVPLSQATLAASVETLTIDLSSEKDGALFAMKWGTAELKASFKAR